MGGGIGRSGLTCGALVGAAMAIGVRLGRLSAAGDREPSYDAARHLVSGFQERFGSTGCRELTGIDLTTPRGRQSWADQGMQQTCGRFVEWAVGEVCRITLNSAPGEVEREKRS